MLGRRGQRDGSPGLSSVAATWVLFVDALHYLAHPHNKRLLLAWSQRGREQPPSPALVPAVAKSPPRHLRKLGPSQGSASDCLGPRLSGSPPRARGALVGLPLPDPQEARAAAGPPPGARTCAHGPSPAPTPPDRPAPAQGLFPSRQNSSRNLQLGLLVPTAPAGLPLGTQRPPRQ